MRRLVAFLGMVFGLILLLFGTWLFSSALLPEGFLRPYFSRIFSQLVGEFTFERIFLANFLIPFLGIQFMNLFRVGKHAGGLYILPIFWIIYGLLLGTNSFVYAEQPIPFSISVLWTRTGFSELLAYTASYEASRN